MNFIAAIVCVHLNLVADKQCCLPLLCTTYLVEKWLKKIQMSTIFGTMQLRIPKKYAQSVEDPFYFYQYLVEEIV